MRQQQTRCLTYSLCNFTLCSLAATISFDIVNNATATFVVNSVFIMAITIDYAIVAV